jgi:hypothetical protein
MSGELSINNPAELAMPFIDVVDDSRHLSSSADEQRVLIELDDLVDTLDLNGKYFTQTNRALAVPVSFKANEQTSYINFDSLTFEGRLATFSIVKIGRIIGATSVRALCLSFTDVVLIGPDIDSLDNDHLLHVPALAVDSMWRTSAA